MEKENINAINVKKDLCFAQGKISLFDFIDKNVWMTEKERVSLCLPQDSAYGSDIVQYFPWDKKEEMSKFAMGWIGTVEVNRDIGKKCLSSRKNDF